MKIVITIKNLHYRSRRYILISINKSLQGRVGTNMEYETLKTFVELAQIKNFTKAAEKLHVVQTTVSSRISVLEKELGTALFERTNKQVRLTKQGELFLPYAQRIIDLSDESAYRLKTSLFYKHYLTIGGIDIIWRIGLSALISEYLVENPNVAINSETYSSK